MSPQLLIISESNELDNRVYTVHTSALGGGPESSDCATEDSTGENMCVGFSWDSQLEDEVTF